MYTVWYFNVFGLISLNLKDALASDTEQPVMSSTWLLENLRPIFWNPASTPLATANLQSPSQLERKMRSFLHR